MTMYRILLYNTMSKKHRVLFREAGSYDEAKEIAEMETYSGEEVESVTEKLDAAQLEKMVQALKKENEILRQKLAQYE